HAGGGLAVLVAGEPVRAIAVAGARGGAIADAAAVVAADREARIVAAGGRRRRIAGGAGAAFHARRARGRARIAVDADADAALQHLILAARDADLPDQDEPVVAGAGRVGAQMLGGPAALVRIIDTRRRKQRQAHRRRQRAAPARSRKVERTDWQSATV